MLNMEVLNHKLNPLTEMILNSASFWKVMFWTQSLFKELSHISAFRPWVSFNVEIMMT